MPRYHFDLRYDEEPWSEDPEGLDLDGPEQARVEALDLAGSIAKEKVRQHWRISVRVRDSSPEPLLLVELSVTEKERT
jgi:hypothetical protein